jgi:hypothetical protein
MRFLVLALMILFVGCGPTIREMATPTSTKGKVTFKGQPLGDVSLYVQPLGEGHPKPIPLAADGTFQSDLTPGKYVYSIVQSPSKTSEQALKKVDPKYLETSMDRTILVTAGEELTIALD